MSQTQKKPQPDSSIDRRTFLKAAGAGGGAAALGVGSTQLPEGLDPIGEVRAWEVDPCYPLGADPVLQFLWAGYCEAVLDVVDTSPSAIEAYLHGLAVSEFESAKQLRTLIANRLEDAQTMAHIEARHRIASSWEDGLTSSQGYDAALEAIDEFYSTVKTNAVNGMAKALLQHGFVSQTAIDDGNINDTFLKPTIPDSYDGDGSIDAAEERLYSDQEEVEFDLYEAGASVEVPFPTFHYPIDGDDDFERAISESEWKSYDSETELITLEAPEGDLEVDPTLIIQNVVVEDGDDLPSQDVFDGADFAAILDTIDNQWSTVRNNYDETFVSDLYGLLDDGTISPSDIRGIDGLATWMSGTHDATESSYRMALQMQLGLEQSDLSEVSHMDITYHGPDRVTLLRDSERPSPDSFGTHDLLGHKFARGVPGGQVKSGFTYETSPDFVYMRGRFNSTTNNGIGFTNLDHFDEPYAFSTSGEYNNDSRAMGGASICLENGIMFIQDGSSTWAFDVTDASSFQDDADPLYSITADCPPCILDGGTALTRVGESAIKLFNTADGSTIWEESVSDVNCHVVSDPSESYIYYFTLDSENDEGAFVKRSFDSDGIHDIEWTLDLTVDGDSGVHPDGEQSSFPRPDGEFVYLVRFFAHGLLKIDAETGDIVDSKDISSALSRIHGNQDMITVPRNHDFQVFDADDLSHMFTGDIGGTGRCEYAICLPSGEYIVAYNSDNNDDFNTARIYDGADGSIVNALHDDNTLVNSGWVTTARRNGNYAGAENVRYVDAAYFFDADSGEEIDLSGGYYHINALYNADGEEVESTEYDTPEYDTTDVDGFAEYLISLEEATESLQTDPNWSPPDIIGGVGDLFDGWPLSLWETVVAAVAVIIGIRLLDSDSS